VAPSFSQPRFTQGIASVRPKGAARYEFWAPKIGRRVTLSPLASALLDATGRNSSSYRLLRTAGILAVRRWKTAGGFLGQGRAA
jgi:hypothetical protein